MSLEKASHRSGSLEGQRIVASAVPGVDANPLITAVAPGSFSRGSSYPSEPTAAGDSA